MEKDKTVSTISECDRSLLSLVDMLVSLEVVEDAGFTYSFRRGEVFRHYVVKTLWASYVWGRCRDGQSKEA